MNKKKIIRIVFFVLAVALAVYAFTNGVLSLAHRDSGYYDVEFTAEGNIVLYQSGLHLVYYAEGSSSEIRQLINQVQKTYTALALNVFKLTDSRSTYEGVTNLASINAAVGEWVPVDAQLYDILKSAYSLVEQRDGYVSAYSLFAGALFRQWETLRFLDEPAPFDPINDPDKRALMQQHARWLNTPGAFDLAFDDEQRSVKLTVCDEYRTWAGENEIEAGVLDLNALRDAYVIRVVSGKLIQAGYTDGYLYTDSGLTVYLGSRNKSIACDLLGYDSGSPTVAAQAVVTNPASFCRFTAFAPSGEKYGYYCVEQDGKKIYRHLYPDIADGEYRNILMSCTLAADKDHIVELTHAAIVLNALRSAEDVNKAAASMPDWMSAAYTLQEEASPRLYLKSGTSLEAVNLPEGSAFELVFIDHP